MVMRKLEIRRIALLFAVTVITTVQLLPPSRVVAGDLVNKSVTISNPQPDEATDMLFHFELASSVDIGSVVFDFCTNNAFINTPCDPPTALDVQGVSLVAQSGATGFNVHPNTTANRLVLSRLPSNSGPGVLEYHLSGVHNTSEARDTVYVRIYVLPTTDGTGTYTDAGAVAYSTGEGLNVGAYVPPFLLFCVGVTVEIDCTSTEGSQIDLGELEPNFTTAATSQYAGATNDESGYTVTIYGTTLTAGNQTIPPLQVPTASQPGISQFGINLRDNSSPDVGSNAFGPGSSAPTANYATVDSYQFISGDIISIAPDRSSYDRLTVSYIVNVNADQPPGVYAATFTYIAVASF